MIVDCSSELLLDTTQVQEPGREICIPMPSSMTTALVVSGMIAMARRSPTNPQKPTHPAIQRLSPGRRM
jgi:hypothetical protein